MRYPVSIVLALGLVSCSNDPNIVKAKYLEIGNKYFARTKYKEASIYYRKALAKDPKYGEGYYHFALTLLKQNQLGNAVSPLRRAIELLPTGQRDSNDAKLQLSQILLLAANDPNLAARSKLLLGEVDQLATGLLTRTPQAFEGHKMQADLSLTRAIQAAGVQMAQASNTHLENAIAEYRKSLELKPGDSDVMTRLARCLTLAGRAPDAEQIYKSLLAADKKYLPAYKDLYRLYIAQARYYPDAETILKQDIDNNPTDYSAQTDLAAFYLASKRPADVEKILDRLKTKAKEFPPAYLIVADFYLKKGDADGAVRQLREGMKSDPSRSAEYQKRIIDIEVRQGKSDQAYQQALDLVKHNPADMEALATKAALLLEKGSFNEATSDLHTVLRSNPDDFVALYNLGRALAANGEWEGARKQLERAIQLRSTFVPARVALAELALTRGDYLGALNGAQELQKIDANNASAQFIEGSALLRLNRYNESRAILQRLNAAAPNQVNLILELGVLSLNEKKYVEALAVFRRAAEIAPNNLKGLLGVSETLVSMGNPDQALTLLASETQKRPDNPDLRRELGNLETRLGQFDRAIADYTSLIDKYKASPGQYGDVLFRIGAAYRQKGDLPRAIEYLQKANAQLPGNAYVLNQLAVMQEAAGHYQEAVASYRQVIKNNPDDAPALNNLAYLLAETGGNLDEALTFANRAKQRLPNMWEISDTIGWIYIKKNLSDNAIEVLSELTNHVPGNPTYHYHLAMALSQKGDKLQARKEAQLALEQKPGENEESRIRELMQKLG